MPSKLLPKPIWKNAVGAASKPKRLNLTPDKEGFYHCPVQTCDGNVYKTQRGCRKHVYQRHGWFYYFDERPKVEDVLPENSVKNTVMQRTNKSNTRNIPMFLKSCTLHKTFKRWLMSAGGGLKSDVQADQISCRVLKYLKFCCSDSSSAWEIPKTVVDYCIGSVTLLSDFVDHLKDMWAVGYAGIIGYMNSISHMLDFRRSTGLDPNHVHVFIAAEIYLERVRKCLTKKMKAQWNVVLSVEHLTQIGCWASLDDLQAVIPFHGERFAQILINSSSEQTNIPAHDLSFSTAYIIVVLFLMVKGTRPMTFIFLTVTMIRSIGESGVIDQTTFKTQAKYGFDTLIFSRDVINILNGYVTCIRPRLSPICGYLLISKTAHS